jgi:hypothetical protein
MAQAPEQPAGPPVPSAVPIEALRGEDDQDTRLLRDMAQEAVRYVRSFDWCVQLHEQYFGDGIGGVVALFLFRITIRDFEVPEWVWIIVGDLPPAYLGFHGFPSPRAALLLYIEGVEEWLAASPEERASGDLIPIEVPPRPELIEMLSGRAARLRSAVLPNIRDY